MIHNILRSGVKYLFIRFQAAHATYYRARTRLGRIPVLAWFSAVRIEPKNSKSMNHNLLCRLFFVGHMFHAALGYRPRVFLLEQGILKHATLVKFTGPSRTLSPSNRKPFAAACCRNRVPSVR